MSQRTVILSSFEEYLSSQGLSPDVGAGQERERNERLSRFPYSVMLQVSYPELDFANRWCWQLFGPPDGECLDRHSEYRVCDLNEPHSHTGKWMRHWWAKTDYDFGFNEWYFVEKSDQESFLANVDKITWGENYPEQT